MHVAISFIRDLDGRCELKTRIDTVARIDSLKEIFTLILFVFIVKRKLIFLAKSSNR